MQDWGLVQLDPRMLDMETFDGNKLFFGTFHFVFYPYFVFLPISPLSITLSSFFLGVAPFFRHSNRTPTFAL